MRQHLYPGLYLGLGFAQAAHSIEEVLTGALLNGGYFPGCLSGIALHSLGIPFWAVPSIRRIPSGTD
jgi:hypothetical protein